eukprot:SAG22_NODE_805_length_7096_cov_28.481206_6_plen_305_part_00
MRVLTGGGHHGYTPRSATEALLVASGGTLTTLLGHPIEHSPLVPTANRLGVVATARSYAAATGRTHRQLCSTFLQELNTELVALFGLRGDVNGAVTTGSDAAQDDDDLQALDILRSISGQPLTPAELSQAVGCGPGAVVAISCPESGSVRYKQSVAGRIFLHTAGTGAPAAACGGEAAATVAAGGAVAGAVAPPASVFYKRAVLRELPYALQKAEQYPFKIVRDVKSNCVEAVFLQSALLEKFCHGTADGGTAVARPYRVEQRAFDSNPIDSRFGRNSKAAIHRRYAHAPHACTRHHRVIACFG